MPTEGGQQDAAPTAAAAGAAAERVPHRGDVCRHWLRGQCRIGDSCNFFHPRGPAVSDEGKKPKKWCRHAFRTSCPFGPSGAACLYTHMEEWLGAPADEREAMNMPSMLPACAANLRRDVHNGLLYTFLPQPARYREGAKYLEALGFEFDALTPPHVRVHEAAEAIAQTAHYDMPRLRTSERHMAALRWIIQQAGGNFMEATPRDGFLMPTTRVPPPRSGKAVLPKLEPPPNNTVTPSSIMKDLQLCDYVAVWSGARGIFGQAAAQQAQGATSRHGYDTDAAGGRYSRNSSAQYMAYEGGYYGDTTAHAAASYPPMHDHDMAGSGFASYDVAAGYTAYGPPGIGIGMGVLPASQGAQGMGYPQAQEAHPATSGGKGLRTGSGGGLALSAPGGRSTRAARGGLGKAPAQVASVHDADRNSAGASSAPSEDLTTATSSSHTTSQLSAAGGSAAVGAASAGNAGSSNSGDATSDVPAPAATAGATPGAEQKKLPEAPEADVNDAGARPAGGDDRDSDSDNTKPPPASDPRTPPPARCTSILTKLLRHQTSTEAFA